MVFIVARRGTISRRKYMDRLPEQVERYFSSRSVMIIYPTQLATNSDGATSIRGGVPVNMR
jgi:hypothetical protein